VTDNDGAQIQSGILLPPACEPGKQCKLTIPIAKIPKPGPGSDFWLRVSVRTKNSSDWSPAGFEVAWQQMQLSVHGPSISEKKNARRQPLEMADTGDRVVIKGKEFSATFSRDTGTLASLSFGGHEMLAPPAKDPSGPMLQIYRAPTDNDKGFGHWLARDWQEAGLNHLDRRADSFTASQPHPNEVVVKTIAISSASNGGYTLRTIWTIHGSGYIDMDSRFQPFGRLPDTLPRVGLVMRVAPEFESFRWYGRGPWENYPDRQQSADLGVWSSNANAQYVPYVRPQENGNKEDVRWLTLTDASGRGLFITSEGNPIAVSALHFTVADLAAVRHSYELKPRPEVVLSLDARQCGLGNSSCGPGVLKQFAVPPKDYVLKLQFSSTLDF
jgi:beta-galactosidase